MQELDWWKSAVIYEIYPRSFQDSNRDGIGDLEGIMQRFDYLIRLGIDAIWIAPIYKSPMADFGYDVADYCDIDPIFGTMQNFDSLLQEAHCQGLKVILDFVPNHTSDQHPWFLESRSSRDSSKRDWYLWRDQPNNWLSNFGGSAWEWDEATDQYYLHSFLKQQPDLNWRNPDVRKAMFDTLRFWLEKGVDGFRVDVMWLMIKDDQFRDNPPNPDYAIGQPPSNRLLHVYDSNRPEIHDLVADMRAIFREYSNRVLIGEIYLPVKELMTYYGQDLRGANLPFNFLLIQSPWRADAIARVISEYVAALPTGAWPNWVLGNHDNARIATRVSLQQAPIAALLLLTLPGTLTLYYGDEIGMTDVSIPLEEVQDPAEKLQPFRGMGRDPERTPMQWNGELFAGFTDGRPWLPLGPDRALINVAHMEEDITSLLNLYRRLIFLRRDHSVLVRGDIRDVTVTADLLRYERIDGDERLSVLLNFASAPIQTATEDGSIVLSTLFHREGQSVGGTVEVGAGEGLLIRIRNERSAS
jgi:alpha-glucosidase